METNPNEMVQYNGRSIEIRVRQNTPGQEFEIAGFEDDRRKTALYTVSFDDELVAQAQDSSSLLEGMINLVRTDIAKGLIAP